MMVIMILDVGTNVSELWLMSGVRDGEEDGGQDDEIDDAIATHGQIAFAYKKHVNCVKRRWNKYNNSPVNPSINVNQIIIHFHVILIMFSLVLFTSRRPRRSRPPRRR